MAGRLTAKMIEQAKARAVQYEESDQRNGLSLVIYPSGKKSWCVRYRNAERKTRKVTLGTIDRLALPAARKEATAIMARVDRGDDPASKAKSDTTAQMSVRTASELFMADRRAQKRSRAAGEVQRQFNAYILPAIGEAQVASVKGGEARAIVKRLVADGSPVMANRVHATLARFFKWAADPDRGYIPASPYAVFGKPADELPSRDRVLSTAEIAALWREAGEAGQPFGPLLRLLILTGQRRSEVTGICEPELDRARAEWTIPAERAKNGEGHIVPLSGPALSELASVRRIGKSQRLFTTDGNTAFAGHHKAKARLDAKLQFNRPWRLHDIRRTVATILQMLGEPVHVVEALLNHKSGAVSGIAAVYQRHEYSEDKRHAVNALARFIVDIASIEARRIAFEGMRDTRELRTAIHASDGAWSEYLAALDSPADEREAA